MQWTPLVQPNNKFCRESPFETRTLMALTFDEFVLLAAFMLAFGACG